MPCIPESRYWIAARGAQGREGAGCKGGGTHESNSAEQRHSIGWAHSCQKRLQEDSATRAHCQAESQSDANDGPVVAYDEAHDVDAFLHGLSTAGRDGEVRPTHRVAPKPRRDWRTRADPFDHVWLELWGRLELDPDRTAVQLLDQLIAEQPGTFSRKHLRTLQRRVKVWRASRAAELVFGNADLCTPPKHTTRSSHTHRRVRFRSKLAVRCLSEATRLAE